MPNSFAETAEDSEAGTSEERLEARVEMLSEADDENADVEDMPDAFSTQKSKEEMLTRKSGLSSGLSSSPGWSERERRKSSDYEK